MTLIETKDIAMKLVNIDRDTLLHPVSRALSACGRGPLPILSCLLLKIEGDRLSVTGSDLQIEVSESIGLGDVQAEDGAICLPARKLNDILKNLQAGTSISMTVADNKAVIKAGRSRFTLSTLSADDFPIVESAGDKYEIGIQSGILRSSIERVKHAMGRKDVRHYLNGVLLNIKNKKAIFVATDGHRLAYTDTAHFEANMPEASAIIPAESISVICGLLGANETFMDIHLTSNHAVFILENSKIVTKLIDGKFPDYEKVIPTNRKHTLVSSVTELKLASSRASILANEKYRGVILTLSQNLVGIRASNSDAEESEENLDVNYGGDAITIGVNGDYLREALSVMGADDVQLAFTDSNSSILVTHPADSSTKQVLMPMRL